MRFVLALLLVALVSAQAEAKEVCVHGVPNLPSQSIDTNDGYWVFCPRQPDQPAPYAPPPFEFPEEKEKPEVEINIDDPPAAPGSDKSTLFTLLTLAAAGAGVWGGLKAGESLEKETDKEIEQVKKEVKS